MELVNRMIKSSLSSVFRHPAQQRKWPSMEHEGLGGRTPCPAYPKCHQADPNKCRETRWLQAIEADKFLSPFFRLHGFFTADDVAGINAPADFIHCYSQTANTTLINRHPSSHSFLPLFLLLSWLPFLLPFFSSFCIKFYCFHTECRNHWLLTLPSHPKLADFMIVSSTWYKIEKWCDSSWASWW
jgi:hypothetical protein